MVKRHPRCVWTLLGILLTSCLSPAWAGAQGSASTLLAQFHPYRQNVPHVPGLEPGVTLTQANAQLAQEVLPPEVWHRLAAGNLGIPIQATTDLPPRPSYLDATLAYSRNVSLGPGGRLANYRAGAPFPLLDPSDPQAGKKLAWNFRYRDLGETIELKPNLREVNTAGGIEHSNRGILRVRFGMYRPAAEDNLPQWERQGVYFKNSFELLSPSDQEGRLRILIVYDDDEQAAEQWLYSPQTRRTRKGHVNYLTPIGGYYEALQEEQPPFFFQGYLRDYDWEYGGARVMLVPGFLTTTDLAFGGKHGWYPQMPWELRHVLVLSGTPRVSHPYGKRVFFLDQQTYTPLLELTYDATGSFFRLTILAHVHPNFHPGSNGVALPVINGGAWINYATNRATLFTADKTTIYNRPFAAQRFGLSEILRKGK